MWRDWYLDAEEDIEDRNESFGRDFVASGEKGFKDNEVQNPQVLGILKSEKINKLYTCEGGQLSIFEQVKSPTNHIKFATERKENIRLTKRDYFEEDEYE